MNVSLIHQFVPMLLVIYVLIKMELIHVNVWMVIENQKIVQKKPTAYVIISTNAKWYVLEN